jgi:hypothetical protein
MRVQVSDPNQIDDLVHFLEVSLDAVHDRIAIDEIEVSPLGSLNEHAAALALDLQLRAWEAAHPGVRAQRLARGQADTASSV